jgi:hypothetical protein
MTRTVRVLLHAGLGNQLFMYAAGRALAVRTQARLILDTRRFDHEHFFNRIFLLDRFPIQATVEHGSPRTRWLPYRAVRRFEAAVRKSLLLQKLSGVIAESRDASRLPFDERLVRPQRRRSVVLDGYWQSERYFDSAAATAAVRRELAPPAPTQPELQADLARVEAAAHPVAVCVRLFTEVPEWNADIPAMIAAYRRLLVAHAAERPGSTYFLVTNEPAAFADPDCLGVPFTAICRRIDNEWAPQSLHVISRCREFFLTHSSFHWWAAWLAPTADRPVTYLDFDGAGGPDFVPRQWRRVSMQPRQ